MNKLDRAAPAAAKPFPWKCGHCRQRAVKPATISYTLDVEHDGRAHSVTVPSLTVPRCEQCGEIVMDDAANRQVSAALRSQLGLLSPEQIRQNREALGLTQKQLAHQLRVASPTLSRWETGGQIQQRSLDRLLRLFFAFGNVRAALADDTNVELGAKVPREPAEAAILEGSARAERIARLANQLDELPQSQRDAVLDQFFQLATLMRKARG